MPDGTMRALWTADPLTWNDIRKALMVTSSIDLLTEDLEVAEAIRNEEQRQRLGIELIASENFVSAAVLRAVGSVLTNKCQRPAPLRRERESGRIPGAYRSR